MAPVASPPMLASALFVQVSIPCHVLIMTAQNLRSLGILGSTPHDDISGTGLCPQVLLVHLVTINRLLEQTGGAANHAANITARITRYNAEQSLAGFLGQVRLLEHTLGRVDVWEVEGGTGVAGIENGGQSDSGLERRNHDTVHLVINNVASSAEVHWVNYFIVAVVLVTVKVLCLTAVSCMNVSSLWLDLPSSAQRT